MAQRIEMSLVLLLVTIFLARGAAQSSCTNVIISMSPCLNYITGNSSTPSSGCCSQLASVVRSNPQCLCQVLNGGGSSLGINVNQTQAVALPGACNVQTPPTSQCNAASPADSPAGTPDDSSNTVPSGSGSKTVPTTDDGSSDGNTIKLSMTQLVVLFAAAFATLSVC
ncbi:non-specific lipid transfer protein GPI-anchored 5-like [Argentina anserina]|uniref:non-specific lipid transfer protein GPI-anchored 5-like n=1 Tax=Argentina anserina TaxID=57926 RepID=UPI002176807D|nr:non-specific lipid transfer protein GPI-anchored 5-like [Potentilla anserina]